MEEEDQRKMPDGNHRSRGNDVILQMNGKSIEKPENREMKEGEKKRENNWKVCVRARMCESMCIYICLSIYLPFLCVTIYLFIDLSVCLSIYLRIYLSTYLSS